MTNKHASKQHGMHKINQRRPKSKLRNRRNKAKARERRLAMLQKGAPKKLVKPVKKVAQKMAAPKRAIPKKVTKTSDK